MHDYRLGYCTCNDWNVVCTEEAVYREIASGMVLASTDICMLAIDNGEFIVIKARSGE